MTEEDMKRQAYVEVSWKLAEAAMRGDLQHGGRRSSLPEDAKLLGIYVDDWKHVVRLHYRSMAFQPVPEGCELPRIDVTFDTAPR